MEQLIVLGCGHAVVSNCYNTCFAFKHRDEYFLVDGGGGSQILDQLKAANIPLTNIHYIFVSHCHTDHILGIVWVVRMITSFMRFNRYEGELHIYGHDIACEAVEAMCRYTLEDSLTSFLGKRVIFHPVEDRDQASFLDESFTFFDIHSTKIKQFGFVMEKQQIVFAGDEPYNTLCDNCCVGNKMLLHEAFCLYSQRDIYKPYEKHHSTALDAAKIATHLGVERLVLWHSEDQNLANKKELYTKEAREAFAGRIEVPLDLEVLEL